VPCPDPAELIARPAVRVRHRRSAAATPEGLWRAASEVRLRDTRTLGRLVRWRIPGTDPDVSFRGLFSAPPFTVLADGDTWSVSGLVGSIWTPAREYPRLAGADEFRAWDRSGTVRVLFTHWVEPDGDASTLHSDVRVEPTNRRAALRLRALWAVVGTFERLIGGEALSLAVRRAESG
jgi:hypothetical protein